MNTIKNIVIEVNIDGDIELFEFKYIKSDKMYSSKNTIKLQITLDEYKRCDTVKRKDESTLFISYTQTIEELFKEKYNATVDKLNEEMADGVEFTESEIERNDEIIVPYDPNLIRVSQARFSLKEIFDMLVGDEYDEEPILDLSPDFQRRYVWDNTRKSRLIESILLKIPLPVFYLSRDYDGKYQVVDGVQRLSVIKEFFSNGFKLKNLEYLTDECENRYFHNKKSESLHPRFVRTLRSYQIDCNVIEPETPHKVKLDIFKRLNTGGKNLNNQEIRNSILKPSPRDFIRKLANSKEFILATNNSISTTRMMDQEMIVRYIGFYFIYKRQDLFPNLKYNGKMNEFLDLTIELLNENFKYIPFDEIENNFYKAMINARNIFNEYAFRKVENRYLYKDKNKINKSLFTIFSILLSDYEVKDIKSKGIILDQFAEFLQDDKYIYESITYLSAEKTSIDTTYLRLKFFLNEIYGGKND
ncbi:DUF262 domain-containing protein [Romboutsia hominis]|uniref:Lin0833 protein n=1 Tax=Romboutsia hominis TaxID=1507512 RepID=A0A2P2BQT9_9FIRM|nr:DUF262 domain-containing protein [Romboutsia hominis]CEI72719.1 Lin0833 protein [Romboutsia hominis]